MNLMLSIDVEEWFQVENLRKAISKTQWNSLESRVEKNTLLILEILAALQQKATFFILGWIAQKIPDLIREISSQGHEIASHGFDHEPVFKLSREQFRKDLLLSRELLEKCSGQSIVGFRAPTFSMTGWGLDILQEEGFLYDSSYQPHRSKKNFSIAAISQANSNRVVLENGLLEILLSSHRWFGISLPWSGGGYFRLIPYPIFKKGIKNILREKGSYCFYIHPWELDPRQPKVPVSFLKKFKHYYGLSRTEEKFRALLQDFRFKTLQEALFSQAK
ncbi:MAG: XrtA system polysaccharide deacetylase [Acidobacteriota bacterium]